jgi:Fe-S-cluster containining protein
MTGEKISGILAEVRAVYQELTKRPMPRQCLARTQCCQFQLTGLTPHLTKGEALLAAKAVRATGRKFLPETSDGMCPLLQRQTGRCLIYADRPLAVARIFARRRAALTRARKCLI